MKSVPSQFTRFCVEKSWNQNLCLWRKNDKYQVCLKHSTTYLIYRPFEQEIWETVQRHRYWRPGWHLQEDRMPEALPLYEVLDWRRSTPDILSIEELLIRAEPSVQWHFCGNGDVDLPLDFSCSRIWRITFTFPWHLLYVIVGRYSCYQGGPSIFQKRQGDLISDKKSVLFVKLACHIQDPLPLAGVALELIRLRIEWKQNFCHFPSKGTI